MSLKIAAPIILAIGVFLAVLLTYGMGERQDGMNANDAALIAMGQKIYEQNCATDCHGVNLEGQPNWRSPLKEGGLPSPPHDASGHTWHHDDDLLFNYTKKGGAALAPEGFKSRMPGFEETLTDEEIWAVLSYIKSTWPEEIQKRQEARNGN